MKIWGWLKFVIGQGLPLNWCENESVREFSKLKSISVETLMKYMALLTEQVELEVARLLPNNFGITLDGWSEGSQHFFCFICMYS
jgi:hypothetical protein